MCGTTAKFQGGRCQASKAESGVGEPFKRCHDKLSVGIVKWAMFDPGME